MSKKKEEAKPTYVEAIEYEKYCDVVFLNRKKGMFALCFAQGINTPPKIVARIWMDAVALKTFSEGIQEFIQDYEKEFGKIK